MTTTSNIVPDSVVEKIRKLLALASELNDSKEQAELAMQKAKALAVSYAVDLCAIKVFENKKSEEVIDKGEINLGKRESIAQSFINKILSNHFRVKILKGGSRYSGMSLILIGTKSDIEIATYVNNFLNSEYMRLWHRYLKMYQNAQGKDRNSYFWGLTEGLQSKLTEAQKKSETDAFETLSQKHTTEQVNEVKNQFALTVTSHEEKLDEKMHEFFPRIRTIRRYTRGGHHSGAAREAGFSAGQKIALNRGIGNGGGFIE